MGGGDDGKKVAEGDGRFRAVNFDESGNPDFTGEIDPKPGTLAVGFGADVRVNSVTISEAAEGGDVLFDLDLTAPYPEEEGYADNPYNARLTNAAHQDVARDIVRDGDYLRATRWNNNDSEEDIARIADPRAFGFEYQTYGAWATGMGHFPDHRMVGVGSFGEATELVDGKLPANGEATYKGGATGVYSGELGDIATTAALLAVAQFDDDTPTVDFRTSGTTGVGLGDTKGSFNLSHLDLEGKMTVTGARFDTTAEGDYIKTTNKQMSGAASGSFYGPDAEEIGGTFAVTNGGSHYIGAFGGRQ